MDMHPFRSPSSGEPKHLKVLDPQCLGILSLFSLSGKWKAHTRSWLVVGQVFVALVQAAKCWFIALCFPKTKNYSFKVVAMHSGTRVSQWASQAPHHHARDFGSTADSPIHGSGHSCAIFNRPSAAGRNLSLGRCQWIPCSADFKHCWCRFGCLLI